MTGPLLHHQQRLLLTGSLLDDSLAQMIAFFDSSKTTALRLSLILAACLQAALSANCLGAPDTWAQSYGVGSFGGDGMPTSEVAYGSGYDHPTGIAAMPDGGFVVAGQMAYPKLYTPFVGSVTGRAEATLLRFDADGILLWQRTLDQLNDKFQTISGGLQNFYPAVSLVNQVAADALGNVFIAGSKKGNAVEGGEVPFVAKFSPAGEMIWQNGIARATGTYGTPPQAYQAGVYPIEHMALTGDGGVVVATRQIRPGTAYTLPVLAKFDADGALSLYRVLEHPSTHAQTGPVCQSRDGLRYVVTISHPLSKTSGGANIAGTLLLIFDPEGNLTGQRGWASLDGLGETPFKIIATADNGFATLTKRGQNEGFVLRKFNADASATTLEKAIYPTTRFAQFNPLSFAETPEGGFLIGSHLSNGASTRDIALMKVSAAGVVQFVSLIGGPLNEGTTASSGTPEAVHAVQTTDGGYGFATMSLSYRTGPVQKPDWWVGKTNAERRIRHFPGSMTDEAPDLYASVGSPGAPTTVTNYFPPAYTAGPVVSGLPAFNVLDPGTFAAPNAPTLAIQASGPRIVSSRTVTAVIRQHFSYSIASVFFGPGSALTYSATGLPPGFVINSATGVISGAPQPGSATTLPIFIGLQVTNGTETAQAVLSLRIGEPVPMLTVNGSDQPRHPDPAASPVNGLADTVLQFAVDHPSQLAGRRVTMQASTTPLEAWSDLTTGVAGHMDYDEARQIYVLNTTNYPAQNGVYFRSQVSAPGVSALVSNVVGPFNLASAKPRAGRTLFELKGNELRADFDFRATQLDVPSPVALRVESTTTPAIESSWTDVQDASGLLLPVMRQEEGNPTLYSLTTNNLAEFRGTYFRAIAAGAGLVDSISNIVGPRKGIRVIPPAVTLTVTTPLGAGSGQTSGDPIVRTANAEGVAAFNIKTTVFAGTGRSLSSVSLILDGVPVRTLESSGLGTSIEFEREVKLGPHDFQVLAVDDLGTTGRAGTMPVYVSVVPAVAPAAPRTRDLTFRPELYTVANSGGDWSDPGTWRNAQGNPGVPTSSDLVIIGGATVNLAGGIGNVYTMSLNGGRLVGPGQIRIKSLLSVAGGSFDSSLTLAIQPGATCEMLNAADFRFDGVLLNQGTFNVRGARSILGIKDFLNFGGGVVNFLPPLLPSAAVAAALPLGPRLIECGAVEDAGRVRVQPLSPSATFVNISGGNIISNDGASIISNDGASIISNDGASIISNDGASIISNDGASIISNDGASLIGQDGSGLIGQDVAGFIKVGLQAPAGLRAPRDDVARTGYLKTGGDIDLTSLVIAGPLKLEGGVLTGSGVIQGNLTNNGGFIAPGDPAGSLLVTGDFAQGPEGTLVMEAAGGAAGQFDQFLVGGAASLGGKLEMRFIGGYVPLLNDLLNPMGFASATGAFVSISSNAQLEVTPTGLGAVLDPAQALQPGGFPIFVTDAQRLEGGNFLLRGKGQPASRYTIEASPSPTDFRPIDTVTAAPDGTFEFQDVNAPGFAKRFYRAAGP